MTSNTFRRAALALGVAGAVAFGGGTAFAQVAKCQGKLEGAFKSFQGAASGALAKCADGIRGEKVKGAKGNVAKAAGKCEGSLAGVYGKAATKLRTTVDALSPAPCADTDLMTMGHLLSGAGPAPGASSIKFTEDYLLITAERDAIKMALSQVPDVMNLILEGQTAVGCPGSSATYPNLCGIKVECKTVGCKLGGSTGATLKTATLGTFGLPMNGTEPFDMCAITSPLSSGTESGVMYVGGTPSRTLAPIPIPGVVTVCVDSIRGAGYCDCSGKGLKLNTNFCQDRIVNPTNPTDLCGAPTSAASPDRNFAGTKLGLPINTPGGASVAGDCFDQSTVQFTLVAPGQEGADGLPCTADDTAVPSAPVPVPLTTGTASGTVLQAVTAPGACSMDSNGCIENVNCAANVCSSGTCTLNAATCSKTVPCAQQTCVGTSTATLSLNIGPGAGIPGPAANRCSNYQTGELAGLKMVGAFPSGGGDPPLGDSITAFTVECVP